MARECWEPVVFGASHHFAPPMVFPGQPLPRRWRGGGGKQKVEKRGSAASGEVVMPMRDTGKGSKEGGDRKGEKQKEHHHTTRKHQKKQKSRELRKSSIDRRGGEQSRGMTG